MKKVLILFCKRWEEVFSGVALAIMILTAVFNVFTRYVLQSPMTWAEELECICLVWSTFCGAAAAYKYNLHYGMDFVADRLPKKARVKLRQCITFMCIFLFAYLTVLSFQFVLTTTKTTTFFRLSYKYINVAALLGFASMTVYSVIYMIESFVKPNQYADRYAKDYTEEMEEGASE
ncbi:TRAP transporter small permease [Chakrabartyella piscis]|uniref:TRAP transporter small permease n=1 Tax=Chakrabartyella piscis TaxID=2918914 RepID=UPI0029583874|nr:TRAP transporter small permease [Chakrabartyella piscis]